MVCEGIIAETAYHGFFLALTEPDGNVILPGLLKGFGIIKRHESSHVKYGTDRLRELVAEHGGAVRSTFSWQLLRMGKDILGCVGMANREFPDFPFPTMPYKELMNKALDKLYDRLNAVLQGADYLENNLMIRVVTGSMRRLGGLVSWARGKT